MKLTYTAISEVGNNEKVIVECTSEQLTFNINGHNLPIADDRKQIELNARNYLNEGAGGQVFTERPFFKYFKDYIIGNETLEDIIRVIGITSTFLHFDNMSITDDEYRRKSIEDYLIGWLGVDWTGQVEIQPQFYFLSKDLLNKEIRSLEFLYEKRFLHKVEVETDKNFTLYYLPIHYPDPDHFSFKSTAGAWKKIVKEVNQAVLNLTHGRVES